MVYDVAATLVNLQTSPLERRVPLSALIRNRKLTLTKLGHQHHDTTVTSTAVSSASPRFQLKERRVQRAKLRLRTPGPNQTVRAPRHRHSILRLKRPREDATLVNQSRPTEEPSPKEGVIKTHCIECDTARTTEGPPKKRPRRLGLSLGKRNNQAGHIAKVLSPFKQPESIVDQIVTMHAYMENGSSAPNSTATTNGGDYTTSFKHHDDDRITNNNIHNTKNHLHHSNSSVAAAASNHISSGPPPLSNHHHHHHHHPPTPPIQAANRQLSAASMATLCNIGNTCYLNSVVYTLRFAPHFLHNLHHLVEDLGQVTQRLSSAANKAKSSSLGRNVGGLAGSNTRSWSTKDLASMGGLLPNTTIAGVEMPRSHRQIATEKLHELYCALRRSEIADSQDAFHADTFLSSVQDVSAIFEGNQQQDAHEFLMCVLDSIRETCQALTKVIGECPTIIMNG